MSVLYEDGVGGTLITMVQFWIDLRNPLVCEGLCFNICFKQHQSNNISTGIQSVRHTLLPVPGFYLSSQGFQWRLRPEAVPDSRTLPSLSPPSLSLFSPSSIYPLHLGACQTALSRRPSLQTLTISVFLFSFFRFGIHICLVFSLLLLLSHLSSFSLCLSVNPLIPPCPLRKQQLLWGIYK